MPKDKKKFEAWLAGTLMFPVAALPFVEETSPHFGLNQPSLVIGLASWAAVSFALWKFLHQKK